MRRLPVWLNFSDFGETAIAEMPESGLSVLGHFSYWKPLASREFSLAFTIPLGVERFSKPTPLQGFSRHSFLCNEVMCRLVPKE